jgi:3-(3-hydroxy-phenyl)propionate hydroxylase
MLVADDDGSIPDAHRAAVEELSRLDVAVETILVSPADTPATGKGTLVDAFGQIRDRYDATPGTFYLFRPDQYIAARWRTLDPAAVAAAVATATRRGG